VRLLKTSATVLVAIVLAGCAGTAGTHTALTGHAGGAAPGDLTATGTRGTAATSRRAGTDPAGRVVEINCLGRAHARPADIVLTCADENTYLHVSWLHWRTAAFGRGGYYRNTCTPSCARGHTVRYPALVTLWRPVALPGHRPERSFTRLTVIFTGRRPAFYGSNGKYYPRTVTAVLPGHSA